MKNSDVRTVVMVLLLIVGPISCTEEPAVRQPIPFKHLIHLENEVSCDTCHEHVFDGVHAGLPKVGVCMDCHDEDIVENESGKPWIEIVRQHESSGTEISWVRLYRLPGHVYFSHRRHAGIAGLPCDDCHGDIGKSISPPLHPVEKTLSMNTCMDCHERRGVENDCAWCHR